jgi:hypothetical protein
VRGLPTATLGPSDDELTVALEAIVATALSHPVAAAAAWRALAAEGRAFSRTPEGRRWRERLAGSPLLDRLRVVTEKATGDWISAEGALLPSQLAEALVQAAAHPRVDALLEQLGERQHVHRP